MGKIAPWRSIHPRSPSREAFAATVADREYREVTKLRARALTEAVLQPTTPWPGLS